MNTLWLNQSFKALFSYMKLFWRYIFPVFFWMLIYACIRLINDTTVGMKFWQRSWQTNFSEIVLGLMITFIYIFVINSLISYFNKKAVERVNTRHILKEFAIVFFANLIIVHLAIVPMMMFTDNGLQINDYVIANIIPTLFVLLYFAIVRGNQYLKNFVGQKLLVERISNEQLHTELKFLKAQYHPHFLFNALNTIYFQMDENIPDAKKTVEKFSALLRYQLYDQQQTVPISRELRYLQDFIDIQQIRTSEKLQLKINFDIALQQQEIYPLLLLPLVENAFKYVGGEYKIEIIATAKKNWLEFYVSNSLPSYDIQEKQNGIGLEHLKRRLALLYPGTHEMILNKDSNNFTALLKLNIQ